MGANGHSDTMMMFNLSHGCGEGLFLYGMAFVPFRLREVKM